MKKVLLALSLGAFLSLSNANAAFVIKNAETTVLAEAKESALYESATIKAETASKEEVKALDGAAASSNNKNWYIALALAFVGVWLPIGLARFYLGKKHALTQLLLTIPGILLILPYFASWIWNLVDFVRILSGSLKPEGGEYTK